MTNNEVAEMLWIGVALGVIAFWIYRKQNFLKVAKTLQVGRSDLKAMLLSADPRPSLGDIVGCLAVLAFIAALVFSFLSLATQRKIIFENVGYPSVPTGSFSRVSVLSSNLEHNSFSGDKYLLTMQRSANILSDDDSGVPAVGTLYTVECTSHFWNLCAGLAPGRNYYARWTSSERAEIAIGEPQADGKAIDSKRTRRFDVRGWKRTEE